MALACVLAATVAGGVGSSPVNLLRDVFGKPGFGGQSFAWLFSWRHGVDVVNELLLLLAPAVVLLGGAAVARTRRGDRDTHGQDAALWDAIATLGVGTLAIALLVEPRIGGARDWYLFVPLALPVLLLAVRAASHAPVTTTGRALAFAAVLVVGWLAVGVDAARSAARLEVLQDARGTCNALAMRYADAALVLLGVAALLAAWLVRLRQPGGRWFSHGRAVLALYGAAKRGFIEGVPADDDAAAQEFLLKVLKNVTVMDKGARESITNYEKGVGDLAITYENEVLVGQQSGQDYDLVIPRSTILIENPVAMIDTSVDKHGTREEGLPAGRLHLSGGYPGCHRLYRAGRCRLPAFCTGRVREPLIAVTLQDLHDATEHAAAPGLHGERRDGAPLGEHTVRLVRDRARAARRSNQSRKPRGLLGNQRSSGRSGTTTAGGATGG